MSPLSVALLALGVPAALVAVLLPAARLFHRMQTWHEALPAELKRELGEEGEGEDRGRKARRDVLLFAAVWAALLAGTWFVPGDWVIGSIGAICGLLYGAAAFHRIRLLLRLAPGSPAAARIYLRWSAALHGAAAAVFALLALAVFALPAD